MPQTRDCTVSPEISRGWSVVLAAFVVHTISHGIVYSFGHVFVALQQTFDVGKSELSLIGSICTGALFLSGPVASIMIGRFGFRLVTVIGACVTSAGYVISTFSPNVPILYVSAGAMTGFGFGLMFQAAVVIITESFREYRGLACGIAISGCGIGAFIFNPLVKSMLVMYDWRGTLLILAAINLNCIPCAILLKSQKAWICQSSDYRDKNYDQMFKKSGELLYGSKCLYDPEAKVSPGDGLNETCLLEKVPLTYPKNKVTNQDLNSGHDSMKVKEQHGSKEVVVQEGHTYMVDQEKREPIIIEMVTEHPVKLEDRSRTSCLDSLLLLKNKTFISVLIASFIFHGTAYLPFMYMPDRSREQGLSEGQTVWVVSTIGLTSIIGRIGVGYLVDSFTVSRMKCFIVTLFISGASTALCPIYQTVWSLVLYAVVYGISFGVVISFLSMIVADILGLHRLNEAYGLTGFFNGVGTLVGPPIAGILFDSTGSYDLPFLVIGSATAGSSLMLAACIAIVKRHQ